MSRQLPMRGGITRACQWVPAPLMPCSPTLWSISEKVSTTASAVLLTHRRAYSSMVCALSTAASHGGSRLALLREYKEALSDISGRACDQVFRELATGIRKRSSQLSPGAVR